MAQSLPKMRERAEVRKEDKWNVEALYAGLAAWEDDFKKVCRPDKIPHWPELEAFKGKLSEGADTVKEFFALSFDFDRKLSKLYTHAHMRYDEDLGNDEFKKAHGKIISSYHSFQEAISFAEPELLALPKATLKSYLEDECLQDYRFHLEQIVRLKPHTLSEKEEHLLAMAGKPLGTPSLAFSAFNNADLKFPSIQDSEGNVLELTHAKYSLYLRDRDRTTRSKAFYTMHKTFSGYENSICELLNGHVQSHVFNARARRYTDCLEAALFAKQIDTKVYTNLIETVRGKLPILHRYIGLRKKALGHSSLHMYDLYVPLLKSVDLRYDYQMAEELVIDSVAPLGSDYQAILSRGLKQQRWVDRFENLRKRSGAYSSGCYDSMPYILMNFQGGFTDLMTLAHEAGHSMHSYFSHKNQPYAYSHYPIFLAEVASTFNEELMFLHLMKHDLPKEEKAFLINQKIEDIRATFFRQTMFAEFELYIHKLAEEKIPLTPTGLKEKYHQLNVDYFGPEIVVDPEIDIEWARIPHFYSNFYVYQYATGISAAHALFEMVTNGGDSERNQYLEFLSSGSSDYPLDLLKRAGVNMLEKQPIESIIDHFSDLVDQLGKYLV